MTGWIVAAVGYAAAAVAMVMLYGWWPLAAAGAGLILVGLLVDWERVL